MSVLSFCGKRYTVDHAVKGVDYIHGYNAEELMIVSFEGVTDFSKFTYDGEYMSPEMCEAEACNEAILVNGKLRTKDGRQVSADQVGAMGYKRLLTSADNLNNIREDGVYVYSTSSVPVNAPFENAAVVMVFGADSTDTQKIQLAFRYGEAGCGKFRPLLGGTGWLDWAEIAIATDGIVAVANGGTGASTAAAARTNLGVASAGYGYGELAVLVQEAGMTNDTSLATALEAIYSKMALRETKLVYWSGYPSATTHGWFGILSKSSANNGSVVAWSANLSGSQIRKVKFSGSWQPLEWFNPPMETNVEYRTTERHFGNPKYVKKFKLGSLPQGTNTIDHDLGIGNTEIVSFDAYGLKTSENIYYPIPMISSAGNISITVRVRAAKADIICFGDYADYTGYLTIWYCKT